MKKFLTVALLVTVFLIAGFGSVARAEVGHSTQENFAASLKFRDKFGY